VPIDVHVEPVARRAYAGIIVEDVVDLVTHGLSPESGRRGLERHVDDIRAA